MTMMQSQDACVDLLDAQLAPPQLVLHRPADDEPVHSWAGLGEAKPGSSISTCMLHAASQTVRSCRACTRSVETAQLVRALITRPCKGSVPQCSKRVGPNCSVKRAGGTYAPALHIHLDTSKS